MSINSREIDTIFSANTMPVPSSTSSAISQTNASHATATQIASGSKKRAKQAAPAWSTLQKAYGTQLIKDVQSVLARSVVAPDVPRGFRHFLHLLAIWRGQPSRAFAATFVDALKGQWPEALTDPGYVQIVVSALNLFNAELVKTYSGKTACNYCSGTARLFELLGRSGDRRFAPFERKLVTFPAYEGDTASLADLGWGEIAGKKGAEAERCSLQLVRESAVQKFEMYERRFEIGQRIIRSEAPPPKVNRKAWSAIKTLVEHERLSWQRSGRSQFDPQGEIAREVRDVMDRLLSPATWRAAGCSDMLDRSRGTGDSINPLNLPNMALELLGATTKATRALMVAFCVDTGWNRQSIEELPRNPYVFSTVDGVAIASSTFIVSFKGRANHDVFAHLERNAPVEGLLRANVEASWVSSVAEFDPSGRELGYAVIKTNNGKKADSLLDLLDRYERMANAIRPFDLDGRWADRFLLHLTYNNGMRSSNGGKVRAAPDDVMSRDGVTFMAIRKSRLALALRETGSVAGTRPFAGHVRTNVLMPHYLNSADISAELDEKIRFFQNSLQAIAAKKSRNAAIRLELEPADFDWFRRLARYSGIAAAVACEENSSPGTAGRAYLGFAPTPENLRELYLTHRALRACPARIGLERWRIQGLALLAAVKAIGRAVFANGLRPAYVKAARKAFRDLRDAKIVLPIVLEA